MRSAIWTVVLLLLATLGQATKAPADDAAARAILDKVKALDKWSEREQTMTLTIRGAGGGDRERVLQIFDKRSADGEDKTISFFLSPSEVKGTGFLQLAHKTGDDDQWLYLPELKRTRRITSNLRDQSFMGTDFSYRDLEILNEIRNWTDKEAPAKLAGEEALDGEPCHVIELAPTQEGGYAKIVVWMDKEQLVSRKMDFHDKSGKHVKTLLQGDVRDVGGIPTAHHLEMKNVEKGSSTDVKITEVKYDSGLSDDLFTERQLKRGPS
jgi:outer membrane lipoprotein-sorting protein